MKKEACAKPRAKPSIERMQLMDSKEKKLRQAMELASKARKLEGSNSALLAILEEIEFNRRQLERAHRQWEDAFDAMGDPIFMHDKEFRILRANLAYAAHSGVPIKEVVGKVYWEVFPRLGGPLPMSSSAMQDETSPVEEKFRTPTGETFSSRAFHIRDSNDHYLYSMHILQDVTRNEPMESVHRRAHLALKAAHACSRELLRATDEAKLLQAACRVMVETGECRLAWIGYPETPKKTLKQVAAAGETAYLAAAEFDWDDPDLQQSPTCRTMRSGKPEVLRNLQSYPCLSPWVLEALKRDIGAMLALPLMLNGKNLGILNLYAAEPDAFDSEETGLLKEMADDLALAIANLGGGAAEAPQASQPIGPSQSH